MKADRGKFFAFAHFCALYKLAQKEFKFYLKVGECDDIFKFFFLSGKHYGQILSDGFHIVIFLKYYIKALKHVYLIAQFDNFVFTPWIKQ